MFKYLGIFAVIITAIFFISIYNVNNQVEKAVYNSLSNDKYVKDFKSVNCSFLDNKCIINNISFNDSNATIGMAKLTGLRNLFLIQLNDISNDIEYSFNLSFINVKNMLSNDFNDTRLNNPMDYSISLKFIKKDSLYDTKLAFLLKNEEFKVISNLAGLFSIDNNNEIIFENSFIDKFNIEVTDPNKEILSIAHKTYLDEINKNGLETIHKILNIEHKREPIDKETLEVSLILSAMEFYNTNNLNGLLVRKTSLSHIHMSLSEKTHLKSLIVSESLIDFLKLFNIKI